MTPLFQADPSHIFDFSKKRPADIFNEAILPRVNSFDQFLPQPAVDFGGLEEAARRRATQLEQDFAQDAYTAKIDEDFYAGLTGKPTEQGGGYGVEPMGDYDSDDRPPVRQAPTSVVKDPAAAGYSPVGVKLANYGYASDTTKDYNSNVKRVGHSNNKLVDGYSAALTASLARKHGLKSGDEFEAVAADGKVYRRRYDDTVPATYKGKKLPETVDLYERKGSNKFGGKIVGIRRIDPRRNDLPDFSESSMDYDTSLLPPRP